MSFDPATAAWVPYVGTIGGGWSEKQFCEVVDVVFDHRPERESQGHFTNCVRVSNTQGEGA